MSDNVTADPDLHLLIAGRRVEPSTVADNVYTFEIPEAQPGSLGLASRTAVPAELGLNQDGRRLGVAIKSIELRQATAAVRFAHDSALFFQPGCYPPERGCCWSKGTMVLPSSVFARVPGPLFLIVTIEPNGMRYPVALPAPDAAAMMPAADPIYQELLTAIYRVLLLREPDPAGFAHHLKQLRDGRQRIDETLQTILMCREFRDNGDQFTRRYLPSLAPRVDRPVASQRRPIPPVSSAPALPITPASREARLSRVQAVTWYHCMDFGDGLYTHDAASAQAMTGKANVVFRYPVQGKTVLDIGAWDGFFSFEAERRGASRVLATDHFCWSGDGWGTKAGFDLAQELLGCAVESMDIDIPQISPETVGTFDTVLCMGVLYHVWDPLRVLTIVHSVTQELAIIESALDLQDVPRPALSFVRGREMPRPDVPLSNDPTNFYGPNARAVVAMLEHVGFSRIEVDIQPVVPPRGFFYAFR